MTKQTEKENVKQLVDAIVKGIQEKKGHAIRIADLTDIDDTICQYLVICEGNSPSQVAAIVDSVEDFAREEVGEKPVHVHGLNNALWAAMDYMDVMVHVFVPEAREFYDIDHLWEDADVVDIPDMD